VSLREHCNLVGFECKFMQQNTSWQAKSNPAGHENHCLLRNPKVPFLVHSIPPPERTTTRQEDIYVMILLDHTTRDRVLVSWKGCVRNELWPNLDNVPTFSCRDRGKRRKFVESWSPGQDLKPSPPEYGAGMHPTWPRNKVAENIIIITWRYSPSWDLASCAIRLHWSLSWDFLLHPSIPISRKSSWTSSSHLTLGLPLFLLV
jgi:hypothetical protein